MNFSTKKSLTMMIHSNNISSLRRLLPMAPRAQTSQLKQYEAMDQKKLSKTMTNRSYKKMINTTLIAMLLLHLFPTGPPYNSMEEANFGNRNSSIYLSSEPSHCKARPFKHMDKRQASKKKPPRQRCQ
jgi:hypothetical protein